MALVPCTSSKLSSAQGGAGAGMVEEEKTLGLPAGPWQD